MTIGRMFTKRPLQSAAALCGSAAALLLTISKTKEQVARIVGTQIPDVTYDVLFVAAAVLFVCTGVLLLAAKIKRRGTFTYYLSGRPDVSEFEGLRLLAVRFFGETFASIDRLRDWAQACPSSVIVIYRVVQYKTKQVRRIEAFYVLTPLNAHAYELFTSGKIDGASFLTEHLPAKDQPAYAAYIGGIASSSTQAGATALTLLHRELERYKEAGVKYILTRPTSTRGEELAARYNMAPLKGTERDEIPLYQVSFA